MLNDLQALKSSLSIEDLVSETHIIGKGHRALCPAHDDRTPSCVIYNDHVHCFACGWHADAIGWLMKVHSLTFGEACQELERRNDGYVPATRPKHIARSKIRRTTFSPIRESQLEHHYRQAARLSVIPAALQGRGFELADLESLGVATYGPDAVLPITDPNGRVLALKRRYAVPRPHRYLYATKGCGCPPWCSPGFLERDTVLVIEGELNAAACWLARPDLAFMGIAGVNGPLHEEALEGRVVYIYADGDEPGRKARGHWASQALSAGATKVYLIGPWPEDACDIAGCMGRDSLLEILSKSMTRAKPVQSSARSIARFFVDRDGAKPDLCKRAKSIWDRAHRRLM